ncbi:MAG: hypothetical protein GXO79_03335 [Chlorobi bacterium]|nr:hypothetical protein [Chlorobiota bacterium]
MAFKWRKWNRILHRDFGYFFFGMSIIYGLSGIALNHLKDWNPNYIVTTKDFITKENIKKKEISKKTILTILNDIGEAGNLKKYYYPNDSTLKIFIQNGSLIFNTNSGFGTLEKIRQRPVFNEFNFLHYNNPKNLWTWFSDIFAGALMLLAITGLFIIRGKKGITGRGAWLTALGVLVPLILFILYR